MKVLLRKNVIIGDLVISHVPMVIWRHVECLAREFDGKCNKVR